MGMQLYTTHWAYRTSEHTRLTRAPASFGLLLLTLLALAACGTAPTPRPKPNDGRRARLMQTTRWCIQLQGLEEVPSRAAVATAPVDLVVIEPTDTVRGLESIPMHELIKAIKTNNGPNGERRLCLAYLNIGQAEDYRTYWLPEWRAPTATEPGHPSFLITVDPDGWQGNYPVAYWQSEWRSILWGNRRALLDRVIAAGFDGIYMDWILGFEEPAVVRTAEQHGINPAVAMEDLLVELAAYARARQPGFLLIGQNAVDLVKTRPRLGTVLDGIAQEDLSYRGHSSARWGNKDAGDIAANADGSWSSRELGKRLADLRRSGLQVLTLDYALQPQHVDVALRRSRDLGLVPFVSQTPLDRLPSFAELAPLRRAGATQCWHPQD